jgi:hypothetical protein
MPEDKLTRAERIRLEAFAQVGARNMARPLTLAMHLQEAEKVEAWLYAARDPSPTRPAPPPPPPRQPEFHG